MTRNALKRLGFLVALFLALVGCVLQHIRTREIEVPILLYHKLGDTEGDKWTVHRDMFEQHMQFLAEAGYTSILPCDLVAHKRWGKPLPPKPVIITLDGGYESVLTVAEPVLHRFGFQGVSYLQTGYIAEPGEERKIRSKAPCLTWDEVRGLQERGTIRFGGFGHHNRNLALGDPREEMERCFQELQTHLGQATDTLAYPHGQYREHTITAVRRAGFSSAMATHDEVERTGRGMNLLALRRVVMHGGKHRFQIVRIAGEDEGHVAFQVSHEGIPLKVKPRLVGDHLGDDQAWLVPKTLRESATFRWELDAEAVADTTLRIELWDDNGVVRLYPPAR